MNELKLTLKKYPKEAQKASFFSGSDREFFYIKRGLEQGPTLQGMKNKVLNKKVTLHLAKIITRTSSNHIAQMSLEKEVIYAKIN